MLHACLGVRVALGRDAARFHPLWIPAGARGDDERFLGAVAADASGDVDRGGRIDADRLEPVTLLDGAPIGALAAAADPDGDVVRRLRQEPDVVEGDVLAVERDGIVTPRGSEQVDDLVHAPSPIGELVAERLVLVGRPPDAHTGDDATACKRVDRRQRVGQLERVVHRRDQHARAQPHARRDGCAPRERDQWVVQMG